MALVSYGILGDWGAVTTDKLDPHSLRYSALVTAGAGSLVSIVWILVVGVVYAVLTICLRRQIRGASGPGG